MNQENFKEILAGEEPPVAIPVYLKALWYDARGDWENAHELIQDLPGRDAAMIHAYLHRKQGDIGNAGYWYSRAGKKIADISLQAEWEALVQAFLPGNE